MPNKGRKLFFSGAEVRRFVKQHRLRGYFPSRVLQSVKIALDPRFIGGDAVTIDHAMIRLAISRRGVQYYLKRGKLKKIRLGHRTVLIERKSLECLRRKWLGEAQRAFDRAEKRLKKILGF
jgi:hypothetical protein